MLGRDPYRPTSWGERLVGGLLALLAVYVVARVVLWILSPLVPVIVGGLVVIVLGAWLLRHL